MMNDFEADDRTETRAHCEHYNSISSYNIPTLHEERNSESFGTISITENDRHLAVYPNYQQSYNPPVCIANFQEPSDGDVKNYDDEEHLDGSGTGISQSYDEIADYDGGNPRSFEGIGYSQRTGCGGGDSDDDRTLHGGGDSGDRHFDEYETDENNREYVESGASCSNRNFSNLETSQITDIDVENSRRSFGSLDNSQHSVASDDSRRSTAESKIDLPRECDPRSQESRFDPQVELVRPADRTQELENMNSTIVGGKSVDRSGSMELERRDVEKRVQGGERRNSRSLQREIEAQVQMGIKESLQDELEEELEVGLEECLNPDMQGMEHSILQLLAKSEAEMESLEIRVKAERNRGDISSKPPAEMEGYTKRKEERERMREKNRQRLMGSWSAVVDGNPKQPTTHSTCNFCNFGYGERVEEEGSGDFKSTAVMDQEILELIQRNEVESDHLAQRILNTWNSNAIPIVHNEQERNPSITSIKL